MKPKAKAQFVTDPFLSGDPSLLETQAEVAEDLQ
jgi:hypothetical protein